MKPSEKLDLLLKALYQKEINGEYHSLRKVLQQEGIALNASENLRSLAIKLAKDGFIEFKDLKFDLTARITEAGIFFSEHTSYAYEGYPIITHIT